MLNLKNEKHWSQPLDLNRDVRMYNNPVYGIFCKTNIGHSENDIHRIQGMNNVFDREDIKNGRDFGIKKICIDNMKVKMTVDSDQERKAKKVDVEVWSQSRSFAIPIPRQNFKEDGNSLYSITSADGKHPDTYPLFTSHLVQTITSLLSKKNIQSCWAGVLPGERITEEDVPSDDEDEPPPGVREKKAKPQPATRDHPRFAVDTTFNNRIAGPSHEMKFGVRTTDFSDALTYDRFVFDWVIVPKEDSDEMLADGVRESECIPEHDIEMYVLVVHLLDPRLHIGSGIRRLINHNRAIEKKKSKALAGKENKNMGIKEFLDDKANNSDKYIFELRYKIYANSICSPSDWIHLLSTAGAQYPEWDNKVNGMLHPMEILEVNSPWDISALFSINYLDLQHNVTIWYREITDGELRSIYNYEEITPAPASLGVGERSGWTQEDFLKNEQLNWLKQYYVADITNDRPPTIKVFDENTYELLPTPPVDDEIAVEEDEEADFPSKTNSVNVITQYSPRLLCYLKPNLVIRYSHEHIEPLVIMSTLLPNYNNTTRQSSLITFQDGEKPSRNTQFPVLSHKSANDIKLQLKTLKAQLEEQKKLEPVAVKYGTDTTRDYLFKVPEAEANITSSEAFPNRRMVELRKDAVRMTNMHLNPLTSANPAPVNKIIDYIIKQTKKDPNFTIFPRLYGKSADDDPSYEFPIYDDLTPVGNFDAVFNDVILEGPSMGFASNHRYYRRYLIAGIGSVYRMQLGYQTTFLLFGKSSTGKGYLIKRLLEHFISGTHDTRISKSELADEYGDSEACMIIIDDEADATSGFLVDNSSAKKGSNKEQSISKTWKSTKTLGYGKRTLTVSNGDGGYTTVTIISDKRSVTISQTNNDIEDATLPARTRGNPDIIKTDQEGRVDALSRKDMQKSTVSAAELSAQKHCASTLVKSYQIFCCFLDMYIHSGAICFDTDRDAAMRTVVFRRLVNIMSKIAVVPLPLTDLNARFENDKFALHVFAMMKYRVFVSICSGVVKDEVLLTPNAPFKTACFEKLSTFGLLMVNDEDVIRAASFFTFELGFKAMSAILRYFETKLVFEDYAVPRHGINPTWKLSPEACLFHQKNIKGQLRPVNQPTDGTTNATDGSNVLRTIDFFYLVVFKELSIRPNEYNVEKDLDGFAKSIKALYPETDQTSVFEALLYLTTTRYKGDDYKFSASLNNTYFISKLDRQRNDFILKRITTSDNGHLTHTWALNRAWFDDAQRSRYGFCQQASSWTNSTYTGSLLETALQLLPYPGIRPRTIILPGMTYDEVMIEKTGPLDVKCPQIMKEIEIKPKSKEEYLKLFKKLNFTNPNACFLTTAETDENGGNKLYCPVKDSYELVDSVSTIIYYKRMKQRALDEGVFADELNCYLTGDEEMSEVDKINRYMDAKLSKYIHLYSPDALEEEFDRLRENTENEPYRWGNYSQTNFEREHNYINSKAGNMGMTTIDAIPILKGEQYKKRTLDDDYNGPKQPNTIRQKSTIMELNIQTKVKSNEPIKTNRMEKIVNAIQHLEKLDEEIRLENSKVINVDDDDSTIGSNYDDRDLDELIAEDEAEQTQTEQYEGRFMDNAYEYNGPEP